MSDVHVITPITSTAVEPLLGKTFTVLVPTVNKTRDLRRGQIVVEETSFVGSIGHFLGCRHNWSFPHTSPSLRSQYPTGYDSHRTCTRCGAKQLYSFDRNVPGPYFSETV